MSASRWVHLEDVDVVRKTDGAFLLRVEDEEYWVPKSQVYDPDQYEEGDEGCSISITRWIAEQKGLSDND